MKLSIITATRNRAAWLSRCIESVAQQSHAEKEHIIVDGASTDGTVELLAAASALHPHIRWISEPDRGLSEALNKGLVLATGDAIAVIGDDDFYEPEAFTHVSKELEADPHAGLISGSCRMVRDDGSELSIATAKFTNRSDLIQCWKFWWTRVVLAAPSTFITRTAIDKVGGFETRDRFAMDYRHWIKITEHYRVRTIEKLLANARSDQGSISFSTAGAQQKEAIAISKEYWGSPLHPGFYLFLFSYIGFRCTTTFCRGSAFARRKTSMNFFSYIQRRLRDALQARLPAKWHFARIYDVNEWRGKESRSGTGSDFEQTSVIRQGLPRLLEDIGAQSMLDLPCGDFHWMKEVRLPVRSYIGGDLLAELIERNSRLYANESRRFLALDLRKNRLPKVDVIFCRDCLVHLSYKDVFAALRNIKRSGALYLITTTFPMHDTNFDIRTSEWRPLNLTRPPFCLPPPINLLNEGCTEGDGLYADKSLGLWRVLDLPDRPELGAARGAL